jgi:hypothetical protein
MAGSISGTGEANAAWVEMTVTASKASRYRAEFFIERFLLHI